MKRMFMCTTLLFAATAMLAQAPNEDHHAMASPKETASTTIGGTGVTIDYNSPRVRGRQGHIFTKDGLISHDQDYPYWRAGANTATTMKTSGDIHIGSLNVPAGTYTLFVDIGNPDQWTLVLSKKTGEWGLNYDKTQDLGRVKMTMSNPTALVEDLKYSFKQEGAKKAMMTLSWENKSASVPIEAQ